MFSPYITLKKLMIQRQTLPGCNNNLEYKMYISILDKGDKYVPHL